MAARAIVDLIMQLKGADKAAADIAKVSKESGILGKAMNGLKGGLGMLGGALTVGAGAAGIFGGAMLGAAKAAADEQVGIDRLNQTLKNVVPGFNAATAGVEAYITKTEKLAFADDELRDSLNALVMQTGDLTEAQNLQAVAMDLARAKGMDLETASKLVGKVDADNIGILARYGIQIDANATKEEALAIIREKTAGQAQTFADSAAGSMERAQNAIGNAVETVGGKILGMLEGPLAGLTTWLESESFTAFADTVGTVLAGAFQTLVDVGTILWTNVIQPLFNFFSQSDVQGAIGTIATAIGEGLVGAFNALKEGAGWVFDNIIKPIWDYFSRPEVQSAVMGIASAIGTTLAEAWKVVSGAAEAAWTHVIKPIFDWFGQTDVQETIGTIAVAIGTTLATAWTTVKDIAQGAWDNVLKPIWDYLTSDEVRPIIEGIATAIGTTLKIAWEVISTAAKLAWDNVLKPIWDFLTSSGLAETIGSIANALGTTLKGAFDLLTTAAGEAWKIIKTVWEWLTGQAVTDAETASSGVVTAIDTNLIGGLKTLQTAAFIQAAIIGGNINAGMAGALGATQKVPVIAAITMTSAVMMAIANQAGTKSASTITYAIGQNIGQGLANGMASMIRTVITAATNLVANAIAAAKKAAGIESPSTEFHIMGEDIDQGLADGIWDYRHIVTTSVDATMDHVISHTSNRLKNIPEEDLRAIAEGGQTVAQTFGQATMDGWDVMGPQIMAYFDATWGSIIARAQEVMAYLNSLNLYGSATGGPGYSAPVSNPTGGHRPVQAMARGGAGWVDRPTLFLAGEAGREWFNFIPRGRFGTNPLTNSGTIMQGGGLGMPSLGRGGGIGDTRYRGPGVVIEQIVVNAGLGADGRSIARELVDALSIALRGQQDLQSQVSYG